MKERVKKWTKGPWTRSPSKESGGSFIEHIDSEYVSHLVAFVHASHGMFDPPIPTDEDVANAHLIAAAPDLVEALEDLLASNGGGDKSCGHDFTCVCAEDKAKDALALAYGEPNNTRA